MDQVRKRRAARGGPFLRFGLPMTVFSVVGFYGLVHLTQVGIFLFCHYACPTTTEVGQISAFSVWSKGDCNSLIKS